MRSRNISRKRERRASQALKVLDLSEHVIDGFLLDLGCGEGWLTKKFGETGAFAIGVDKNSHLIRRAKRAVNGCEFAMSDGRHLPFRDSIFRTVVINDVLEHVPYAHGTWLMKEAVRTLTKDGKVYISVMNRWQIFEPHLLIPFMTWMPKRTWDVVYRLTAKNADFEYTRNYFPYTKSLLRLLLERSQLDYEDYTWFYAVEKISHPQQIGNSMLKFFIMLLKKLKLDNLLRVIAEKFSVIIFVCHKRKWPF